MTYNDAAVRAGWKRAKTLIFAALLGVGLAGCETSGGLMGQSEDSSSNSIAQAPAAPAASAKAKVAIAPVIGAPENVASQISQQLGTALAQRQVAVAKPGETADYTVRGYVVAAKEKSSTKVSYIWDVNDPAGKRVNRVTGEESAALTADRDPWTAITPQTVQAIADRTATSLATAIPAGSSAAAASSAVAAASPTAPAAPPVQRASQTTTASISQPASVAALVPTVTGAPGDGSQSLAAAMQRELTRNGVQLASGGAAAYRVEGKVQVGAAKNGTQPIQIEWQVKDPRGNKLGTVSQKNDIPQGSLDGAWGQTADIAAAAAAQGVIKLLPQTQTN